MNVLLQIIYHKTVLRQRMKDNILIKGIKEGSYKDFTELYNLYFSKLFGFVFKLTRSQVITQEIVQDSFVKIWTNREMLNENNSIQSYIFTIAKNRLIDALRKTTSVTHFEDYMEFSNSVELSENNVNSKIDNDYLDYKLYTVKKILSHRQHEIFDLYKEKRLTTQQIADRLSISERTVKNQLSLIIKALRNEFQKN